MTPTAPPIAVQIANAATAKTNANNRVRAAMAELNAAQRAYALAAIHHRRLTQATA